MEEKRIFDDVLDEGEEIIKVVRPNKRKFWHFYNWMHFWSVTSWVVLTVAICMLAFWFDDDMSNKAAMIGSWIAVGVGIATIVLSYLIGMIFASASLKKRYYAYSNKRILVRCGIIGVDYKVLDYKLMGATTATVGVLDRMLGGKTGYLRFGSASSPIINSLGSAGFGLGGFVFAHIDLPYELLKEIKKVINNTQENK